MNDMKSIRFPPPVADEMIRAILEGRKTVTRRVALPANDLKPFPQKDYPDGWMFRKRVYRSWDSVIRELNGVMSLCKYRPGDILYVRETFDDVPVSPGGHFRPNGVWYYRADGDFRPEGWRCKWKPSTNMPREAARLFLRVTDVRVERLQEMTDDDFVCDFGVCREAIQAVGRDALAISFWDSAINPADRALYGWAANPWVWVIAFERCGKTEEEG